MLFMVDKFQFGLWLQKQRESKGWSQADLSRHSGLHRAVISKIENGTKPMPETLTALAHTFGLSEISMFREAGILPKAADDLSPAKRELIDLAEQSESEEAVESALAVLRAAWERKKRQAPTDGRRKKV